MEEGYETVYYLESENGRKKFAVVKLNPCIVRYPGFKAIRSGNFKFVLSDETALNKVMKRLEEDLKFVILSKRRRAAALNLIYDVLAEVLIDGLVFEISVEQALYLSNLLKKFVDEDYDVMRETRLGLLFEESFKQDDDPSFV